MHKQDRHLARTLFDDPVYKRSSHWALSTSAVFSKHFGPYGWGEVRAPPASARHSLISLSL